MVIVIHLMLGHFHHFTELKRILETRPVLSQSPFYHTFSVQVSSKSIRVLQKSRSLNIQNIARVNFKQRSFSVLQEKLNLANVKNNWIHKRIMNTVFMLQKTKGSF